MWTPKTIKPQSDTLFFFLISNERYILKNTAPYDTLLICQTQKSKLVCGVATSTHTHFLAQTY